MLKRTEMQNVPQYQELAEVANTDVFLWFPLRASQRQWRLRCDEVCGGAV